MADKFVINFGSGNADILIDVYEFCSITLLRVDISMSYLYDEKAAWVSNIYIVVRLNSYFCHFC